MKQEARPGQLQSFLEVRCLCGKVHTFLRHQVLDDLGVGRWKCGPCKRRFVIACTPGANGQPDAFWPLFLEQVPSTGDTRQEGLSTDGQAPANVPPELHFRCRCGCRLVGKASMYGHPTRCPRCDVRLILRVGYESDGGRPVPLLEYPEGGAIGQAGAATSS
jgi:hypothetical protein